MKLKLIRLSSILAIFILILLTATPVFAIDPPDALQINSVYAYRHCLEANDQLYVAEYTITYDPNPDESVTDAFLGRLMDGTTGLKSIAPYNYYDQGYGNGVFALYFPAADPNLPTWAGIYSMQIIGNPTANWTATIPSTSVSTFDLWSSSTSITETQTELATHILYLADQLEQSWGISMLDTTSAGSYLSSYGQQYFTTVIPNIWAMAPGAFAGGTINPDFSIKPPSTSYANSRANSENGTLLDTTEVSNWWGVSRMWASTLLFMLGGAFLLYAMLSPTGNYRGLTLLSTPLVIAGGYLGLIPLIITVLIGFFAFALTIFMLFYHTSSA